MREAQRHCPRKYGSKKAKRFRKSFGLLVGCNDEKCRAAKFARKIRGDKSFCSRLQAGELDVQFAGTQSGERTFHSREAQQAFQSFTDYRKNHRMALGIVPHGRSSSAHFVEDGRRGISATTGTETTRPPAASTSSLPTI